MTAAIRVNLEMTYLMAGVEDPILEKTEQPIDYFTGSWIITVSKRLKAIKAMVWIEKIWRPKKQHAKDHGIIEMLAKIH